MAANKIVLQVDFQTGGAQAQIDDVNKKIAAMGPVTQQASQQATAGLKGMTVSVESTNDALMQMGRIIAGLGLAKIGLDLIHAGDEVNRIRRAMERTPGAVTFFDDLSKSIGAMGGDLKIAQEGMQRLLNAGMDAGKAFRWIEGTNKLVAQMGLPKDVEQGWITFMARMQYDAPQTMKSMVTAAIQTQVPIADVLRKIEEVATKSKVSLIALKDQSKLIDPHAFAELIQIWVQSQAKTSALAEAHLSLERRTEMLKSAFRDLGAQLERDFGASLIHVLDKMAQLLGMVQDLFKWIGGLSQPVKDFAVAILILASAFVTLSSAAKAFALATAGLTALRGAGAVAAAAAAPTAAAGLMGAFGSGTVMGAGFMTGGVAGAGAAEAGAAARAAAAASAATVTAAETTVLVTAMVYPIAMMVVGLLVGRYRNEIMAAIKGAFAVDPSLVGPEHRDERLRMMADQLGGGPLGSTIGEIAGPPQNFDDELMNAWKKLLMTDEHKQAAIVSRSEGVLAAAQEAYFKAGKDGIEALSVAHDKYVKDAAGNLTALANYQKALDYEVRAYVEKQHQEGIREAEKNDKEYRRAERQTAITAIEAIADDTTAGRLQLADVRRQAFTQEMQEDLAARDELIKAQLKKDVDAIVVKQGLIKSALKDIADLTNIANLKMASDARSVNEQIAHHRVQTEAEANKAILDDRKKTAAEAMQDSLMRISAFRDLNVARATLVEPQTFGQRLGQAGTVSSIEVTAIEDANRAQLKGLQERKAALDALEESSKRVALISSGAGLPIFATNIPEILKRQAEINADFERDRKNLAFETEVEIQKNRYDLWKRTNEIVIEEQKRVFSSFKDAAGQVFDAIFDRSKSFFASLGDILKRTVLGTAKEFVTNRVAAGLSDLFGYGKPTFSGRFPLGEDVIFGGIGAPPGGMEKTAAIVTYDAALVQRKAAYELLAAAYGLQRVAGMGGGGGLGSADDNSADRRIDEGLPDIGGPGFSPAQLPSIFGGAATPPFIPPMGGGAGGMSSSIRQSLSRLGGSFGVGKNIWINNGQDLIPWEMATATEKLGAVLKSPGMGSIAATIGTGLFTGGLQAHSAARTIGGGALAGAGIAQALGRSPIGGAILGAGVGLFGAGMERGGLSGLAMTTGGGLIAGAEIGAMFGPAGLVAGAAIGAGVGLITGIVGLFTTSKDQQVRDEVRRMYGIDIRDKSVRDQIVQIAQQNFGGDVRLAVSSPAVMELVRAYSLAYGAGTNGLPRPMYSASFQQSTAGGLQLQPVYSGGQVVANPYSGTTTQQFSNALNQPLFMQLNPAQSLALFNGQVVKVLGNNPGAVANANTAAATQGSSRTTQAGALLEPLTVMR